MVELRLLFLDIFDALSDMPRQVPLFITVYFDDVTFDDWTPEDAICLLNWDKPRSLPARFHDAFVEADIPMIFTTNKKPSQIFPRASSARQRRAIKRRYRSFKVTRSLAHLGRPLSAIEKRARREAGRDEPVVRG